MQDQHFEAIVDELTIHLLSTLSLFIESYLSVTTIKLSASKNSAKHATLLQRTQHSPNTLSRLKKHTDPVRSTSSQLSI